MLLALGAASSAMDALQSLLTSKSTSSQTTGFAQNPPTPFDTANGSTQTESPPPVTGGSGFTQISPETMSALIAAQGQDATASTASASSTSGSTDPTSALKDLFSQIDANGDGQISKSEFESALGAGGTNLAQADDVFNKLDANGDGSVSLDEMQKALQGAQGKGGHHHHHHVADSDGSTGAADAGGSSSGAGGANSDPLLQALAGATSTSVTNSDGSTTTSITNADGSVITMTSSAATTSSSSATASYNFLEQMIQRAAQAVSSNAASSLSLNV
ncbi:MAG: EF-hand domain-containing protein [Bradyrhizobium sp.]